jgi:anaerobic magnesium-protoporphyrin IX monomethyl ester cyclase
MKVLLIEPKYGYKEAMPWIPTGKGYIAAVLREHGFEVKIIDNALKAYDDETLVGLIKEFDPDVIGTGGMTLQFGDAKRIAQLVRLRHKDVLLVGGGIHLTLCPEDGLDLFDLVVIGEAEYTLLDVCKRYKEAGKRLDKGLFADIHGLCFKIDGETIRTPVRDFIKDLDVLPLPTYDLLEVEKYNDFLITGEKAVSIMTGRGCPFDCEFCASPALSKRKVRYFSLEYTFRLIEHLIEKYGFKNFRIMDDTFTLNKERVVGFCEQIRKRGLKLNMTCLTHVATSNLEMFRRMKEAGFSIIALGIESGNDRILNLVNKKITTEDAINAINSVKQAGLKVEGLFMIGNIGETKETIEETLAFAKKYNPPYEGFRRVGYNWFQFATPFPGSLFFHKAKDYGEVVSFNYDDYTHQVPVFIPKGLDVDTMLRLRKKALEELNNPFNSLFRVLIKLRRRVLHRAKLACQFMKLLPVRQS